ncbi:uncharacterized protein LOC108149883 isoform X2 [Drosophila elegans]|uniref:uncharacterized protein LOC108149883 isoform X2 n=1 Tax=Drosophila elegans TaxID=30023 RepID=UPI001BC8582C|nr:uncharacterized protein LOC108149883 isoform X2 [Drosophila elegans]
MFVPETEDMLPRMAPRPSAAVPMGHTNEIIRPTVPEVSILFGQAPQDQQMQMQHQQQQQPQLQEPSPRAAPTFASWKKQMLPRVNFSPILATELGPRTAPSNSNPCSPKEYIMTPRDRNYTKDASLSDNHLGSSNCGGYNAEPKQQIYQSRRLSSSSNADVLTICAGTQTDSFNPTPPRNSLPSVVYSDIDVSSLANKSDLAELVSLMESMRQEQQQLKNLCMMLLEQHQRAKPEANSKPCRTTASQCDILTTSRRISPIIQDYIAEEEEEPVPSPQARVIPQFQSPRPTAPIAQSTGYRANTPQGKRIPQLAKPNTEKSMVMNELALKYLRQPVDELMKEMRLGASPKSANPEPLRPIDNLAHSQSPNDISNASYKYLKKYRLLPEEQLEQVCPQSPTVGDASSPRMQLDLENIRNQPKLL